MRVRVRFNVRVRVRGSIACTPGAAPLPCAMRMSVRPPRLSAVSVATSAVHTWTSTP